MLCIKWPVPYCNLVDRVLQKVKHYFVFYCDLKVVTYCFWCYFYYSCCVIVIVLLCCHCVSYELLVWIVLLLLLLLGGRYTGQCHGNWSGHVTPSHQVLSDERAGLE